MDFAAELQKRSARAEQVVERYLPKEEGQQHLIREAMNYSVRSGGKRLRPVLMQSAYALFGGEGPLVEPFMAAMEMIHTYSLVHDDLPALDNDTWRRGRHTCHVEYGEAVAVLAGDGLLNLAFETAALSLIRATGDASQNQKTSFETAASSLARMPDDALQSHKTLGGSEGKNRANICQENTGQETAQTTYIHMSRAARALQILAEKAGTKGMLGGQSLDVIMDGKPLSEAQVDFIYDLKTGALLEGSLMCGAALAGAGEGDLLRMQQIGHRIGLAFQIRDDILDIIGDQETLGKDIGSDEKHGKTTYVTLHGLEKAGEEVERLSREAVSLLEEISGDKEEKEFLRELILHLTSRKK